MKLNIAKAPAKVLALVLVLTLSAGVFAGCEKKDDGVVYDRDLVITIPPEGTESPEQSPELTASTTQSFTDSAGRTVELPAQITRIAPSGALAQMFLVAIAPDLLVTKSSEYTAEQMAFLPDYLADLPVVGQFYGSADLNLETIASIAPEIVIDVGEPKATIVEDMDSVKTNIGIPAIHITADLMHAADAFRTLGKLLGREAKGEQLAEFCGKILLQTTQVMDAVGENKVTALWLLGDAGLNVIAKTSFHAEVFDWVTDNVAVVDEPSSKGSGNETDLEQISVWNPQVILFAPNSVYGSVSGTPVWTELDAVKNKRYYEVPFGPDNWMGSPPSINRYLGLIWLTKTLYPDVATYNLTEQITEYYKLFYGHDLTAAEIDSLGVFKGWVAQ
jgi:iron complex transport system substrate-binding protein